jgi:hypothetical protein
VGIKMKIGKLALSSTLIAVVVLMIPLAFANGNGNGEPGYSPGYWKHQLKVMFNGRGHMQESLTDMEMYADYIDGMIDTGDIESLDGSLGFTNEDAFLAFTDTSYNHMWTTIANWYNEAAGLEPYVDTD